MPNQHPITPPQELVLKWHVCAPRKHDDEGYVLVPPGHLDHIATQAAQWGSDQELEACLGEIRDGAGRIYIDETRLRVLLAEDIWTARRPKPPSLKEQALEALEALPTPAGQVTADRLATIRRALEALDD